MDVVVALPQRRPLPIVPDQFETYEECLDWFRSLSTSTLKAMWDAMYPDHENQWHIHCDEVHRVMNERGEGDYVCV